LGPIVLQLILTILRLVTWTVIASAIFSWLLVFEVVNTRNRFVYQFSRFLDAVTTPLLRPIRRVVPNLGGVDVTPIVLLLALWFIGAVLQGPLLPLFTGW
jgi:YggT family protein